MQLTRKAERFLDLPDGTLGGEALVSVVGNRQVTVEGHCVISEYDPSCIRLKTGKGALCIRGDGLHMDSLHAGGVCIEGCVVTVEFS